MPRSAVLLGLLFCASCSTPSVATTPPPLTRQELERAECRRDGQTLVYRIGLDDLRLENGEILWRHKEQMRRLPLAQLREKPSFVSKPVLDPILLALLRQGLSEAEIAMILGPSEIEAGMPAWHLSDDRVLLWPEVAQRLGTGPIIQDRRGRLGPALVLPKLK